MVCYKYSSHSFCESVIYLGFPIVCYSLQTVIFHSVTRVIMSVSFFFCAISGFVQALSKHFVMIFLSCFSVFLLLPCTNNKYDLVLGSIFSCLAGLINNIFILFFRHVHLQFCHLLKIYIQGISRMIFKVIFIFGLNKLLISGVLSDNVGKILEVRMEVVVLISWFV